MARREQVVGMAPTRVARRSWQAFRGLALLGWLCVASVAAQEPAPPEQPTETPPAAEAPAESPQQPAEANQQPATEQQGFLPPATVEARVDESAPQGPILPDYTSPTDLAWHEFDGPTLAPPTHGIAKVDAATAEKWRTDFETASSRFREIFKRLYVLQYRFAYSDSRSEREEIQREWADLKEEGETLVITMRDLATQIFVSQPVRESVLYRYLIDMILEDAELGRYWTTYRMILVLRQTVGYDPALDPIAATAAFRCGQFEEFAKFVQRTRPGDLVDKHIEALAMFDQLVPKWQRERELRAAELRADDLPRVRLITSKGEVVLELFENEAPNTVANFISLVEKGFYDGLTFHRVLDGFMAQGGCPEGTGSGGPGYQIACECYELGARDHFLGSIAMAHAGKDTGGSQFYLCYGPQPQLDGRHTVFGRVISGMSVVERITRINPEERQGNEVLDVIEKAEVIRKRDHEYVPVTIGGARP